MRLLCAVVGCAGEGPRAQKQRCRASACTRSSRVRRASTPVSFPLPSAVEARTPGGKGPLSLNLAGRRLEQVGDGGALDQRRQFELLHCECCGETFLGGVRARSRRRAGQGSGGGTAPSRSRNRAPTGSAPGGAIRRSELRGLRHCLATGRQHRRGGDPDNKEHWQPVWLDPVSGVLHRQHPAMTNGSRRICFSAPRRAEVRGLNNGSPSSHRPCRCPRCKSDYAQRRGFTNSLIQYSPIQSLRPGFSRTTQLLATEVYDVLARGKDSNPKLVSFADSRQTAARTALDVEHLHHRDLLREVLMVTLMEVDAQRRRHTRW